MVSTYNNLTTLTTRMFRNNVVFANNVVQETIAQIIFTPILKSLIIYGAAGIEYIIGTLQSLLGIFHGLVGSK